MDKQNERITTFVMTLLEYSGIKYYSEENFIVEALTFVLLTCDIDITKKFQLLYYQLQNDYVPWGFSAPRNNDARKLNSVDIFISLVNIMLRLDVSRQVLQCHHCKSKCCCEVVATFLIEEIDLLTMQDPINQIADQNMEAVNINSSDINEIASIINPITMLSDSFIIKIEEECQDFISSQANSVLNDMDNGVKRKYDAEEATLSSYVINPSLRNYDAWKGHNDEGIPIINFDALFGHTEYDLDLQLDCRV